jgi:hypothetical protein
MLRLPKRVLDPADVADYCVGDSASAWTSGKNVIIHLNREDEEGTDEWDIDGHGLLASIIPVRASLAAGDLRLLYLGWLRCVQSLEVTDDEPEPPVPAGLGRPARSMRSLLGHSTIALAADVYANVLPAVQRKEAEDTARMILGAADQPRKRPGTKRIIPASTTPRSRPATGRRPGPGSEPMPYRAQPHGGPAQHATAALSGRWDLLSCTQMVESPLMPEAKAVACGNKQSWP